MRKMLFTLALLAAPALAVAQQPTQTQAAHDTTKAKPKTPVAPRHHKKPAPAASRDTSKAKPAMRDTTKKP